MKAGGRSKIKGPDYQPQSGCGLQPRVDAAAEFDLDNPKIHDQVVADYEAIRRQIRAGGINSFEVLNAQRHRKC